MQFIKCNYITASRVEFNVLLWARYHNCLNSRPDKGGTSYKIINKVVISIIYRIASQFTQLGAFIIGKVSYQGLLNE